MLTFKVTKRTNSGQRWRGTATLTPTPHGWQLTEEGQWGHLPGLSRQTLTWDGYTLTVGEGTAQHTYACTAQPNGTLCGQYKCGADVYGFRSRHPLTHGPRVLQWWVNGAEASNPSAAKHWRLIAKHTPIR